MEMGDGDDLQSLNDLWHNNSATGGVQNVLFFEHIVGSVMSQAHPERKHAVVENPLHCTIENGIDIWRARFRETAVVTQPVITTPWCTGCMQEEDYE